MRYFFNLRGELSVDDPDGAELPDLPGVRQHAVAMAEALMRRTRIFREGRDRWAVQVTDLEGREILVVPFSETSAAMESGQQGARSAFLGKLGWKTQLHLGKQMASNYPAIADQTIPEYLLVLLHRLDSTR
jgi:hypothetical protein